MFRCPIRCKKVIETQNTMHSLSSQNGKIEKNLLQIQEYGYQILRLSHRGNTYFATVLDPRETVEWRNEYGLLLYRIPFQHPIEKLCHMDIAVCSPKRVEIIDWYSKEENLGYGSIFLKSVIDTLQAFGYQELFGKISPRDAGRYSKLEHIYKEKFQFSIAPMNNGWQSIRLDLTKK